jgi:hypothetical protein
MSRSLTDVLIDITRDASWQTIDDLVDGADADAEFDWSSELDERALRQMKKVRIRCTVKRLRDETGMPVVASIVREQNGDGEVRGYKQEAMFDLKDYEQVTAYYASRANYHADMARRYAMRAHGRFGVQLALPLSFREKSQRRRRRPE